MAQRIGWSKHFDHLAKQLEDCINKIFQDVGEY